MEEQKLKAFLTEEKPTFKRRDKPKINIKDKSINVVIRNIYSRKLEDLTFNDLNMIGYTNPNTFVNDWVKRNGLFDINKIVWVVVYVKREDTEMEK